MALTSWAMHNSNFTTYWSNRRETNKELSPPVAVTGVITNVGNNVRHRRRKDKTVERAALHAQDQTPAQVDEDRFVSHIVLKRRLTAQIFQIPVVLAAAAVYRQRRALTQQTKHHSDRRYRAW